MKEMKFEEALQTLEEIVEKLETGNLELDESVRMFERGVELSLYCRQQLQQAEGKIQRLVKSLDGEVEMLDLE